MVDKLQEEKLLSFLNAISIFFSKIISIFLDPVKESSLPFVALELVSAVGKNVI